MRIILTHFIASIRLTRPLISSGVGLSVVLGQLLSSGGLPGLYLIILGFVMGYSISASSMISNDIYDIEVDRINAPDRVLPSQQLNISTAWGLTILSIILGTITGFILDPLIGIIAIIFALLGLLYNYSWKEKGLPGNLIVSSSAIVPFVLGGLSVGNNDLLVWIIGILVFSYNLSGELVGGIMDYVGDRVRNSQSVAHKIGSRWTLIWASVLLIIGIILLWLPVILDLLCMIYASYAVVFTIISMFLIVRYVNYMLSPKLNRLMLEIRSGISNNNSTTGVEQNFKEVSQDLKQLKDLMFVGLMLGLVGMSLDVLI